MAPTHTQHPLVVEADSVLLQSPNLTEAPRHS